GEWCADLAVGTLVRVSYAGETMDHTRVVLWPSRRMDQRRRVRGRHAYWVLSADGDVWEEDLSGRNAATGPSGGSLLDQATGNPPDGRRLYRFRARPSLDEVVELAAECRATMLRRGQAEAEGPTRVVLADGAVRPGHDYFPWLVAPRPWVLTEPLPGMPIGTVVDPLPVGALRDGSRALGLLPSCGRWARLEQVDEGQIVEWAAKRTKELLLDLGAEPDAMGAAEPVGGTETPPLREARSSGGDRLGEKLGLTAEEPAESAAGKDDASGDARTLWVDWDEQGERRKEFKRAVAESSDVKWDHHRLPADRTCLHTCKMMVNLSGSPRAWLERFLREKGIASTDRVAHELRVLCDILEEAGEFDQINLGGLACLEVAALRLNLLVDAHKSGPASYSNAKYLSPLTDVDQLMAPGLRSHVSRRAKEEYELMQGDRKAEAVAAGAAGARVPPREGADDSAKGGKGGGGGMTDQSQPAEWAPAGWANTSARRAPLALASGDRDLFPLPRLARPPASRGGSRARIAGARRRREHELVNGAIDSLNWLAGWEPDDVGPPRSLDAMGGKHAGIVQWVASEALRRQAAAPSPCPSQEASLSALLKGCSIYDTSGSPRNLASFVRERVSLPPSVVGCLQVDDIVGEAGRTYLKENQKRMRRPIEEIDFDSLPTPYFDPLLKRNKKMYHNFLKDLSSRGLLLATLSPAEQAGLFFVKKADSDKMRMIVDARRANAWFGVPPSVQLLSCEGFGRVEVKLPEGVAFGSARGEELLNGFKLFLGMTDVKDCFYRMRIPVSLAKFFSLPAAPAHVLGLEGHELEGARLGCDTLVFPCIGALPMGFSWSLFLAQDANEERVVRSDPWPGGDTAVSERVLMSDRGPPLVVEVEPGLHGGAYVYVDNMGVLAPSEGLAKSALESWTGLFEGVGLDLHKSSVGSGACEALGTKLDLELMRSGVSDGRFWKVYLGLGGLLARGRATGRALEVVLGHCTFCGLALRGSLSCWHASYRFIQRHYLEPARLWAEVVKEIKMFRGLLTLMVQDWWRPWNCCVLQTDASESGWGMAQSFWPQHVVEQVGRLPERARFRSALGRPARESALAAANLAWDSSGALCSFEDMKNPDSLASDPLSSWELDPGFAEVPWQWLRKGAWETVRSGVWRFAEDILILEARALVKSIQRLAKTAHGVCVRQLFLSDNMSVVLSFSRARSSRFSLLVQIRRFYAYAIALGARVLAEPVPQARTPPQRAGARRPAARTRALAGAAAQAGSRSDPSGARAIASPGALGRTRVLVPAPLLPSRKRASQAGRHLSALDERDANGLDLAGDAGEDAEGDSSSSGSDSVVEQLGRTRARMRQLRARRAHRRAKLYADAILAAQGEGVSLLETLAVTQATQVRYQRYLDRFYSRAGLSRREILAKPDTEIDELMCNYMTEKYLQGEQSNYGDQTVAAWVSANPDFGRVGGRKLPRTWRALKAWRRLTPGRRRKALALPVWCGLAWRLAQRGHLRLGIFLMIGVSIYGRPSTLLAARRSDLVPPSPGVSRHWALLTHPLERKRPSKRGHFDEGCPLDSPYLQGLDEVFGRLASTTSKEPLWNFSYPEAATLLKEAAEDLGVAPVTLYQMRHSGASIDLAKGWRSLTSAQRRGEWTQAKSMHRYEHSSRLGSDYAKLDPRLRATCEEAERQLALILTGQYLGDLFAGCRAVSRAAEAEGFRARSWDVIYDAEWQDLLSPAVLRAIKSDARAGRLVAAAMAPPCQTFSLAHDRSRPVRSREKPWGFPASELTPADAEAVELGNRLAR
ncbi:unnamed protein product, partial [Prorocentrum cordatum]